MRDPRHDQLAELITGYSLDLQAGDIFHIELRGMSTIPMGQALIRAATKRGAVPFWFFNDDRFARPFLRDASEAQISALGDFQRAMMERTDAFVSIRGSDNLFELADVPAAAMAHAQEHILKKVHLEVRVPKTRWVVLRWPNEAMAQAGQQSQEAFEDFYFRVCTLDYAALSRGMDPLVARMDAAREVRIQGPETDLRLSIAGLPVVKCDGMRNVPDGEVYTAPVRDSINGHVHFNAATIYNGQPFDDLRLRFDAGRVVEASAADAAQTKALNGILDSDEGSRYVGEFAIGVNPEIHAPMRDILFDEKIYGSFHMALGNAYDSADNGNKSRIHWDLVQIQTPSWGGGEIHFDGVLIRKDGEFVPDDLAKALNRPT